MLYLVMRMKGGLRTVKKHVLIGMLLMLVSFSVFLSPLEELEPYSHHWTDELVFTVADTISGSDVITESVPTIIKKWHVDALFPPTHSAQDLSGAVFPFEFIDFGFCATDSTGFMNAVQHQSNYLPSLV
mgnify:CR=1 FL=1